MPDLDFKTHYVQAGGAFTVLLRKTEVQYVSMPIRLPNSVTAYVPPSSTSE